MTFGEKLKELRKSMNWSQEELSAKLGVHRKHISRYETNRSKPSLEMLQKLSKLFAVSTDYLINDNSPKNISLKDRELLLYFERIDKLKEGDRKEVKAILRAILSTKTH